MKRIGIHKNNIKKTEDKGQQGGAVTPCKANKKGPQVATTSEGMDSNDGLERKKEIRMRLRKTKATP